MTAPRIFCIPATRAPVAAVLARGQRPVRRRPRAMDASGTGRGGSRSAPLSLWLRAASCGDVRHRTGTRLDRDRGHTGARSARHVGREAGPARDDAEETSRSRRRCAHRWWSVRRVPRQPQLRPRGLVRARTRGYARDARGSAVGGLGWIRSHARGDDRWTPASPRRGEPGFGRVVGGRSVGGRTGPATAPREARRW